MGFPRAENHNDIYEIEEVLKKNFSTLIFMTFLKNK